MNTKAYKDEEYITDGEVEIIFEQEEDSIAFYPNLSPAVIELGYPIDLIFDDGSQRQVMFTFRNNKMLRGITID